ncbi:MFS transporter [Burkholderia sp. Ac-20379]|uniref:MFS transporter n=1 Tax=Burkholderia sp. Ac-20379 TaxID=2703900 RepID=UPI00197EC9E9|nr:MFS transporter [Burkholderia sp. Ac-20379]
MSEKQRKFIARLTCLIAGGMFIDGFILGGMGIVMPAITRSLDLSLTWQGLIGASTLIGIFIGSPIGGYLADKLGRKPMFIVTLGIFLLGSFLQFFLRDAWHVFAVRLFMGLAIGADYSIGWPLLAEFSPARLRGKLLAFQEVAWYVGYLVSFSLGYVLVASFDTDWRVILGLSTIPSLAVFVLRLGSPESPRWLISKGRTDEAMRIANDHMHDHDVRELHREIGMKAHAPANGFSALFSPKYLKTTIFICVFWITNVTPYFAIGTFAPSVLQGLGVKNGLAGALLINGVVVAGSLAAMLLIERAGRRMLSAPPMWICTLALVVIGLWSHASPAVVILCFVVFSFFNAIPTALTGVYPGEVYPTEVRGAGVGFGMATSRIGAAAGTFVLPVVVGSAGVGVTMLIAAAICGIGAAVAQALAPETRGMSLSDASNPGGAPRP